jgi:aminoglycoside phosphotransferase (APT) family kinase protein
MAPPSPTDDAAFRRWLAAKLEIADLTIAEARTPSGGGWSSETWLLTLRDAAQPTRRERRIVVRLAPLGPAMFPEYDLGRQVACMRALTDAAQCPVPAVLADDLSGSVIERPLYVMDFVAGETPSDDRPTFFEAGFLFDAAAADQRRFHTAFLAALAALHARPPDSGLVRRLTRPGQGRTALERELAWLRGIFDWGRGAAPQPLIDQALAWLAGHLPDDDREVLLWGDARPANTVVRDFTPVALLDWELATLGPPELDVFWLLEMNAMRSKGGLLPGFLDDAASRTHYEALSGNTLRDAAWHIRFAAAKVALLMLRHLLVRVELGHLAADHAVLTDNIATRRLRAHFEEVPS